MLPKPALAVECAVRTRPVAISAPIAGSEMRHVLFAAAA